MASIKPIEGRSVHQIQSGQVIVDLCSVVKELVENALDAGASAVTVTFKQQGLEAIEVQDNGTGISPDDYSTLALKHYTSKLTSYDDLAKLETFGFRGEALSSLCAVSKFHVVTARDGEAPKGTKLDFETSGRLAGQSVAACTKGTTMYVEDLFYNLPVRRRELEKNVKREYGKVLNLLHAYACVSTGVRLSVSNQMKGKKAVVFSTRGNQSTRENIANIYGAKTIPALIPLDLALEMQPTAPSQILADSTARDSHSQKEVKVVGHISKPVFGEGRQTPDRQMFFVNSRPCLLPQISKAFNEVYKAFNITQSPFIFANLLMDTQAYDVNVSPDKRTIMLHEQTSLIESLKEQLNTLFENSEQTVPVSQIPMKNLPTFKPLSVSRSSTLPGSDHARTQAGGSEDDSEEVVAPGGRVDQSAQEMRARSRGSKSPNEVSGPNTSPRGREQDDVAQGSRTKQRSTIVDESEVLSVAPSTSSILSSSLESHQRDPTSLIEDFAARNVTDRRVSADANRGSNAHERKALMAKRLADQHAQELDEESPEPTSAAHDNSSEGESEPPRRSISRQVQDFNARMASPQTGFRSAREVLARTGLRGDDEAASPQRAGASDGSIQSPSNENHRRRAQRETSPSIYSPINRNPRMKIYSAQQKPPSPSRLSKLSRFAAPGTQTSSVDSEPRQSSEEPEEVSEIEDENDLDNQTNQTDKRRIGLQNGEALTGASGDDSDYVDEDDHRLAEEARVKAMVEQAEAAASVPSQENKRRAMNMLRSSAAKPRDSVLNLVGPINTDIERIAAEAMRLQHSIQAYADFRATHEKDSSTDVPTSSKRTEEERLSLIIEKTDFKKMRIVGQFNLGFILALRYGRSNESQRGRHMPASDDLFIIDQHASDEIYNFSKLYLTTSLTPQPLVHPRTLDLTAVEEEIIFAHKDTTLHKNGFNVSVDTSGDSPVGKRCRLLTLPTSKDTVFNFDDLNELIGKLIEAPSVPSSTDPLDENENQDEAQNQAFDLQKLSESGIIRPDKVRKMLAMRACRSSIMVGKPLSQSGMRKVVRHMGEIQRPWNCPHGRPTMRHLCGLNDWVPWEEGEGLVGDRWGIGKAKAPVGGVFSDGDGEENSLRVGERGLWDLGGGKVDWGGWVRNMREEEGEGEDGEGDEAMQREDLGSADGEDGERMDVDG